MAITSFTQSVEGIVYVFLNSGFVMCEYSGSKSEKVIFFQNIGYQVKK